MALRNILEVGDPGLLKKSRPVKDYNKRLHTLLDDMRETLENVSGAGLAAPQVGVLRRAVIVLETNVGEGESEYFIELINPRILELEGEQSGPEACLSLPGEMGIVTRPERVKIQAEDRYGVTFETEGYGITARAFCHEIDHLEGVMYTSIAERMMTEDEIEELYAEKEAAEVLPEPVPDEDTPEESRD